MRHSMPFKINIVILKTDISSAGSPTSFVLHRVGAYPRVTYVLVPL